MAERTLGPWKVTVRDGVGATFDRFLGFDGRRLAWVWRSVNEQPSERDVEHLRECYRGWGEAGPRWLGVEGVVHDGRLGLVTACASGVRFDDLVRATGKMPLGAAAWLALEVAEAMGALDERRDGSRLREFSADSLLVGFDGTARLTPWPDLIPPERLGGGVVTELDYFLPEQIRGAEPLPGWRAWAPSVVLLHALAGASPFRDEVMMKTAMAIIAGKLNAPQVLAALPEPLRTRVREALSPELRLRPTQPQLLDALRPLAQRAWLDEALQRHFPAEEHEQRFERTLAQGAEPEPLPPELVRAVAAGDDDSLGVLADWMLSEGRPRGQLAAIQRKLSQGADLALQRSEAELLVRHRSLLPYVLRERLALWKPRWSAGWLVGLELRAVPSASELEEILTHPTLRFLRRLRVSEGAGHSQVVADVLSSIQLPALSKVELDGAMVTHGARLKAARPQLEVSRTEDGAPFPPRRRPEKADPGAKVGIEARSPAQGPGLFGRVWDWLNRGD